MSEPIPLSFTLNGKPVAAFVEPRKSLADFLREDRSLTATRLGCEMGTCGACLVMMDGAPAHACLVLAVQAEGAEITTLEGQSEDALMVDLQAAFVDRNASQCGFCTSGMLTTALAYVRQGGAPDRAAIREALSGNYCRCTGYEAIVDAIASVAETAMLKEAAA
ncbi:(2Fe-2S)-binding protein [Sulfitobacter sp. 1A12126]|uniref:(2Fe-2S)-binding protein n=1 Tax=Sulfitobacter sp. 1A12126 TaxID=3368591 RepID=UPI0037459B43